MVSHDLMSTTSTMSSSSPSPSPTSAALPPPPGETSNLSDPPTMATVTAITVAICFAATTIPLAFRTYVRAVLKGRFQLEDAVCVLSWIGLVVYLALTLVALANHAGTHEWDLTVSEVPGALYWLNANSTAYGLAIMCTKLSVLLLYQRVFFPQRWSRSDICLKVFMGVLLGFYIGTSLAKIWQCVPREHIWDKSTPGSCINISVLFNTSGIFNTVTDIITLLIPVKVVWSLNMKRKRKLAVLAVFTVGSIAPAFSIIGLVVRFRVSGSPDLTWNQLQISLWAGAEVSTGIICVCLPELPSLWHRPRSNSSLYGQSSSGARDGGPSAGVGFSTSTRVYTTRCKPSSNDMIMGKRDLEFGQLLEDDSDGLAGTTLEMDSRLSHSPERSSEKDFRFTSAPKHHAPRRPERAAIPGRTGHGDTGIMKTVSMEVSSTDGP